jgi:hypothetical protein
MLHGVDVVRTDVSEECIAKIIRTIRIPDDGVTMFLRNIGSYMSHTA